MDYLNAVTEVLGKPRYRNVLVILLLVLAPIFSLTSDIIIPSTLEFNPISDPMKIVLMSVIVLLMSINGSVLLHNYEARKSMGKKTTILGTLTALFTTTCPVCQPIWLVWLGFGSATAFLAEVSIYLSMLSIGSLLLSLHYSLKPALDICEVRING